MLFPAASLALPLGRMPEDLAVKMWGNGRTPELAEWCEAGGLVGVEPQVLIDFPSALLMHAGA